MAACSKDSEWGRGWCQNRRGRVKSFPLIILVGSSSNAIRLDTSRMARVLLWTAMLRRLCVTPHTHRGKDSTTRRAQGRTLAPLRAAQDVGILLGQKKSRYKRATDAATEQLSIWQKRTTSIELRMGQDQKHASLTPRLAPKPGTPNSIEPAPRYALTGYEVIERIQAAATLRPRFPLDIDRDEGVRMGCGWYRIDSKAA